MIRRVTRHSLGWREGLCRGLSAGLTDGVRHKDGLGTTDDSKSDTTQFGVEGRALQGFKCCSDVVGRVGKWFEGRTEDKGI